MDEQANKSVDDRSGIVDSITIALRQPSFLRVTLILDPILFAVILALLFSPIYAWLRRRRVPTPLALVIMLVGLTVLFLAIAGIMGISIARFSGDIGAYASKLNGQLDNVQSLTKNLGISKADLHDALDLRALTGAIGSILGGVADFLS